VLRSFNVNSNEVSGALLDGVNQFQVYGSDDIVYDRTETPAADGISASKSLQQVGMWINGKSTVIETLPASDNVKVAYDEFDQENYFVVSDATAGTVKVYQNPENPASTVPLLTFDGISPQYIDFDAAGRFLVAQQGSHLVVYDFYEGQKFDYQLPFTVPATQNVYWIDDFHLATVINGQLEMWEFDGTNMEKLVPSLPSTNQEAVIDNGNNEIYSFAPSKTPANQVDFEQTSLKVKPKS
jgi:hypothetical protein